MLQHDWYRGTPEKEVVWGTPFHINDCIEHHRPADLAALLHAVGDVLRRMENAEHVPMYILYSRVHRFSVQ